MNQSCESYKKYTRRHAKSSPLAKNCLFAFLIGGGICVIGQLFTDLYKTAGADTETAGTLTSVTLIAIAVLLTALDVFDDIAKVGGAGTLVPITGFANATVSPAIDNKAEGWVLGVGAKLFSIAGPVILYGVLASTLYGVIYYIMMKVLG